jgi:hypothetical protein
VVRFTDPVDVGGLRNRDLLTAQGFSDNVQSAGERGVAKAFHLAVAVDLHDDISAGFL